MVGTARKAHLCPPYHSIRAGRARNSNGQRSPPSPCEEPAAASLPASRRVRAAHSASSVLTIAAWARRARSGLQRLCRMSCARLCPPYHSIRAGRARNSNGQRSPPSPCEEPAAASLPASRRVRAAHSASSVLTIAAWARRARSGLQRLCRMSCARLCPPYER